MGAGRAPALAGPRGERPAAPGTAAGAAGPGGPVAVGGSIGKCLRGGTAWEAAAHRDPLPAPAPLPAPGPAPVLRGAPTRGGHCPAASRPSVRGFASNPRVAPRLSSGPGLRCPSQSPLGQRLSPPHPFVPRGRQLNGLSR